MLFVDFIFHMIMTNKNDIFDYEWKDTTAYYLYVPDNFIISLEIIWGFWLFYLFGIIISICFIIFLSK